MINLSGFSGRAKFSTWLYRISINACIDVKRKTKRSRFRLFADSGEIKDEADKTVETNDTSSELDQIVNKLSDRQRSAIILRFYHGKSVTEIAEIMECEQNTVRTHLYRGIEKLKKMVKTDL